MAGSTAMVGMAYTTVWVYQFFLLKTANLCGACVCTGICVKIWLVCCIDVLHSGAVNPFAMTIGKPSAAANPFVARAKEEEQSRRVPIGQLQSSGSAGATAAQTTVWPTLAVVYSPQPVPPQHGYNPFLWSRLHAAAAAAVVHFTCLFLRCKWWYITDYWALLRQSCESWFHVIVLFAFLTSAA